MANKKDIKWAENVCKQYGVTGKFEMFPKRGYSKPYKLFIQVSSAFRSPIFRSVVLHEVAHCLNFKNKKYLRYHSEFGRTRGYLKKMALRAEVYTDKVAAKLAKKHGVKKYITLYRFNDKSRQGLKEFYGY